MSSDLVDLQRALAQNPDVEAIRKRPDRVIQWIAVKTG
jgi:hypothetical protein